MALLTSISAPSVTLSWDGAAQFDSTTPVTVPVGAAYLVVRVFSTASVPSTLTYDGVELTNAAYQGTTNVGYAGLFYLPNPAIGTFDLFIAKNVGATYQLVIDSISGASSVGAVVSSGGFDTDSSAAVTTVSGDLVLDALYSPTSATEGAGQTTQLLNTSNGNASSETATGTTTTMSWTHTAGFVAHIAVPFSAGAAPMSINDVDSDNIITNGQTGVVITGSGFEAAQGSGTVTIDGIAQTVTAWSDTAITITHVRSSMKYGAQTLSATNDSADNDTHPITVNPASGSSYVDLSGYVEGSADITGTPSLADGDQLEYENTAGSFSVAISADGLVTLTGAGSPSTETFDVYAWDLTDSSWGSAGTYSLQDVSAPVLSSPLGTSSGSTTATGTVTTDEDNGTLYWEVTASATPTSPNATFISDATSAGDTQAVSATGSQIVSATGLSAATSYYIHFLHVDAASNESNVSTSTQFTTQSLTAPTLEQGVMNPNLPVINSTGSTLTLTFSEAVTTSAATGLTLSTGETLTYSSGSTTDTIVYTISPYAQEGGGGEILNFAGGANVIEATVGGTDVEAFSDALVSSQSTTTAPVVVGDPTVDETGTLLTVVFSSASLANQTTPAHSPFTLTGTLGGVYTFTNAAIPANTGVFTVSPAVEYNDVLSLSFTQAGGTFTDGTTGIELATFTDAVVNNTSSTDNEPPVFTAAPDKAKTTISGHTIRQTINENGTVYGVRLPIGSGIPSAAQVKAGTDSLGAAAPEAKNVAAVAGQSCSFVFSTGEKNTTYDYFIVAEDSVPNLQAAVVRVTATTDNAFFNDGGQVVS